MSDQLRYVTLRDGERVPALGQGTWHMGEERRRAAGEVKGSALLDIGQTCAQALNTAKLSLHGFKFARSAATQR